jgi:hypothetical protein
LAGAQVNTASGPWATVGGGGGNTAGGNYATVGGGLGNTASGYIATVGGGGGNTASGYIGHRWRGGLNTASGDYSAIPGGYNLRVGHRSFGFSGQTSPTQTDLSANSNIAAFVDVDLWLYSRDRTQASQLRFYEAQAHGSGAEYVAFQAPNSLTTSTTYTLPADLTTTNIVATGILQTDGSGNLSWLDPSALAAATAWALTGNSGTNPTVNFLGTTDDQPVIIKTNGVERMRISNSTYNGYVGIGVTNPAFRLELPNQGNPAGRGRANSWVIYSSMRWKEEIRPIENALERVMQLRGYHFRWKPEYGGTEDIGFLAEEVARVVPEVVSYEPDGQVAGMDYSRLTALLVEALKQQQREIAELRSLVEQLLRQNGERGTGSQPSTIQDAWLGQNIPNPFAGTTTIPYYIPAGVSRAELVVRDVGGRELKRLELAERGAHGQVVLEMGLLGSGTYEYALVLDGRVVAVKQMTLVR